MRRVKKVLGLISGILLAGAFITGCNPDVTTGNGNEESDKYSISFEEDISSLSVEAGDSITINVSESTGTWKIAGATVPDSISLTSESDESGSLSSITITGVSVTSSASFTIYPEEAGDDESYDKTISVTVTDPYFTFTLTLDDDLAEEASTIAVTYGSSQHTGSENADVTYTAGAKTATVKFEKFVANEWNWFNNITVNVYDSSENLLNTSLDSNNYFQYTDTSFTGYTVSYYVESEMTVNFTFSDFIAASVKVTYGYDSTTETVDGVVADNGASASVKVSSTYANSSGYMQIVELLAYDSDGQEISVEMKTSNSWFAYKSSSSEEFEYALKTAYTEFYSKSFAAGTIDLSELSEVSVSELLIEAKDCDWSAVTGPDGWWIYTTAGDLSWTTDTYYKLSVTDSSTIATLIENGLAISASDGFSATIVISYK